VACTVLEFGLSEDVACALIHEIWEPACDGLCENEPFLVEKKVASAAKPGGMQNAIGCRALVEPSVLATVLAEWDARVAVGTADSDEDARIRAKFMTLGNSEAVPTEPTSLRDFIYSPTRASPIRELVPGWIAAGHTVMVSGRGGSHKSRLILQLCMSILYDRELFSHRFRPGADACYLRGGARNGPRGGIDVGRIEFLSYEDDASAIHRRVEGMKRGFQVAAGPGGEDPCDRMAIWELRTSRTPLLEVEEGGQIKLTAFGYHMLRRWEKLAEDDGRHMVLWFDSFFNAVQFLGKSKNIDICAQRVIGILDHWCAVLNCTILGPFHPSRAGDDRGDTGYSPAFQDTIREVLQIREKVRRVKDGRPHETEGTGKYELGVMKWNEGRQGKKLTFAYDDGELISYDDASERDALTSAQAAVKVIEKYTYGDKPEVLARLRNPHLTDDERTEIERGFPNRIRRHGEGWKIGEGQEAIALTGGHWVVARFREITGNDKASEKGFLSALEEAKGYGLLGYAESGRGVRSDKRRPAGYCIAAVPDVRDEGEEILY
jgi:hypothetical protein